MARELHKAIPNELKSKTGKYKGVKMALENAVKKNWIEIQKKFDIPVNAIGVKIKPKDKNTLRVWKDEGIDDFMKK